MKFEEVINNRTATRKFKEDKIDNALIKKILLAGRVAPTAKNNQPQKIYVIESNEYLEKIDKVTPCRYNAPICLLVCSDKEVAWTKDDYSSYEMDATIVATHMILEATNLGIDSVWVRAFDAKEMQKEFNIESNIVPVCLIPLGYKTDDYKGNPLHNIRKELEETVTYL